MFSIAIFSFSSGFKAKELKTGLIWQQWLPYQQYISFQEFCKVLPLTFQNVGEITLELLFLFCDKIPCQKQLMGGQGYSGSQPKGTGTQAGQLQKQEREAAVPLHVQSGRLELRMLVHRYLYSHTHLGPKPGWGMVLPTFS